MLVRSFNCGSSGFQIDKLAKNFGLLLIVFLLFYMHIFSFTLFHPCAAVTAWHCTAYDDMLWCKRTIGTGIWLSYLRPIYRVSFGLVTQVGCVVGVAIESAVTTMLDRYFEMYVMYRGRPAGVIFFLRIDFHSTPASLFIWQFPSVQLPLSIM